jgi:hypothetical protein
MVFTKCTYSLSRADAFYSDQMGLTFAKDSANWVGGMFTKDPFKWALAKMEYCGRESYVGEYAYNLSAYATRGAGYWEDDNTRASIWILLSTIQSVSYRIMTSARPMVEKLKNEYVKQIRVYIATSPITDYTMVLKRTDLPEAEKTEKIARNKQGATAIRDWCTAVLKFEEELDSEEKILFKKTLALIDPPAGGPSGWDGYSEIEYFQVT